MLSDKQTANHQPLFHQNYESLIADYDVKVAVNNPVNPMPRPHQVDAINQVEAQFKTASRGQLIMACGTGKTYTTLWIKERINATTTLVLLPSLNLLSQTLKEWTYASSQVFDALCVCSDDSVGKIDDDIVESIDQLNSPVTSNVDDIKIFLSSGKKNKVIFSTYQSSILIAQAHKDKSVPCFDLAIADEAHRCVGEAGTAFTTILDNTEIRASKRLFTTATPRIYSAKNKSDDINIASMDDKSIFGDVFHKLSFGEAIERNLLTDYRVVIIGVDKPMIANMIKNEKLVKTEMGDIHNAKTLASQIGLLKTIKNYSLNKIISFHGRVKSAELFSNNISKTNNILNTQLQIDKQIDGDYVSGLMPTDLRRHKLDQLKNVSSNEVRLLSNARCLSEGVDVPALDGIAFIDPRNSHIDIIQAIGRVIRLSKNKAVGTIVLPVFIENDDDIESSLRSSRFNAVWQVINALRSHDEKFSISLDQARNNMGKGLKISESDSSLSKISYDIPTSVNPDFIHSLKSYLIEKSTSAWHYNFGLLESYVEKEGHAMVECNYITTNNERLGDWVSNQRINMKKNKLSSSQIAQLESLTGWVWDAHDAKWQHHFNLLKIYEKEYGHVRVVRNYKTTNNERLGDWVANQRASKKYNKLSPSYITQLESLTGWIWDVLDAQWQHHFNLLKAFEKEYGHVMVVHSYETTNNEKLGIWVTKQRVNKKKNKLNSSYITQLESLTGWAWDALDAQWQDYFNLLKAFEKEYGHARVVWSYETTNNKKLGDWVSTQRINKKKNKLSSSQITQLESLTGWVWNAKGGRGKHYNY